MPVNPKQYQESATRRLPVKFVPETEFQMRLKDIRRDHTPQEWISTWARKNLMAEVPTFKDGQHCGEVLGVIQENVVYVSDSHITNEDQIARIGKPKDYYIQELSQVAKPLNPLTDMGEDPYRRNH